MMNNKSFEVIKKQGRIEIYQVIRDNETGVLYMAYGSGFGLTVMIDPKGDPLLDEDYRESNLTRG